MARYLSSSGAVKVVSLPYTAVLTPDLALGERLLFDMELTGNVTIANPSNPRDGQEFVLRLRQDGTGGRTISFGSAYRGSADTPLPSLTPTANSTDYFAFKYNSASGKCDHVAPNKGF